MAEGGPAETERKVSFSLAGCGFLGIYHIGAAACLCEHVPHLLEDAKFCGASAGALIACCLICKVPMDQCVDFTLRLNQATSKHPLRGWEPSVNIDGILRTTIEQVLPEGAHTMCTDRLFVSVTKVPSLSNKIISKFNTRKDLVDALLCSAYVPGFSSFYLPKYDGDFVLDGGISNNLPVLDEDTITICPWAGEHSICPQDPAGHSIPVTLVNMSMCPTANNVVRLQDAFFASTPEVLKDYCWQGYDDALRFLQENHLIHCRSHRVLAVLTNLEQRACEDCVDCEHHRTHAKSSILPSKILACWEFATLDNMKRLTSVVTAAASSFLKMCFIPTAMFREFVLKLYSMAYLQMDRIKKGGLSEELQNLAKKLYHPKALLWEFFILSVGTFAFRSYEFWLRMLSELIGVIVNVRKIKNAVFREVCLKCGNSFSMPAGPLKPATPTREQEQVRDKETTLAESRRVPVVPEVVVVPGSSEEEEDVESSASASTSLSSAAEKRKKKDVVVLPKTDGPIVRVQRPEKHELLPSQDPESMAVWVDIHADSVEMDLPLPQDDQPKEEETVHVEGLGDIRNVLINPMMVPVPEEREEEGEKKHHPPSSTAAAVAASSSAESAQTERIHRYVHEFEHFKNVFTIHYVDEHKHQRTEKLFVEEAETITAQELMFGPTEDTLHSMNKELMQETRSQDAGSSEEDSMSASASSAQSPQTHDLNKEVAQLIEKQLFLGRSGQRQFQKEYEAIHQLRLKRMKQREVRADRGHYSLQLVRFGPQHPHPHPTSHLFPPAPPAPTPQDLSRSSSLLSVNGVGWEEEGRLRSVSDAATLAHKLRLLRKRKATESKLCSSHSSLGPNMPMKASSLEAMDVYSPLSLSHSSLASTSQFPSMHALHLHKESAVRDGGDVPRLFKSMSDTSEVAAHLRRMKKWRTAFSDTDNAPSSDRAADADSSEPTTLPTDHATSNHTEHTSAARGKMHKVSTMPLLASSTASAETERVPGLAAEGGGVEGSTVHAAQQEGEGKEGRLERSRAIQRSGTQRLQLLSSLKELQSDTTTPPSTASDETTSTSTPTATSTTTTSTATSTTSTTTSTATSTTSTTTFSHF